MINLRAEIVKGRRGSKGEFRHEGLSRTVCRILSLYNLTPLLQKLRETEGKDSGGGGRARVFARNDETATEDRRTTRKRDRQDKIKTG